MDRSPFYCHCLTVERNPYRFSFKEDLGKRFADRRANGKGAAVDDVVRSAIQKEFPAGSGVARIFFLGESGQVPDKLAVTLVVLAPDQPLREEKATTRFVETVTREYGSSARTFKSALGISVAEPADPLREEARKLLAWQDIDDEALDLKLDDTQIRQLDESLRRAKRDLREAVWRPYQVIVVLGGRTTSSGRWTWVWFIPVRPATGPRSL